MANWFSSSYFFKIEMKVSFSPFIFSSFNCSFYKWWLIPIFFFRSYYKPKLVGSQHYYKIQLLRCKSWPKNSYLLGGSSLDGCVGFDVEKSYAMPAHICVLPYLDIWIFCDYFELVNFCSRLVNFIVDWSLNHNCSDPNF